MNDALNETLRRIEQKLDEVLKISKTTPAPLEGEYTLASVTDEELDDKYGNPEIRLVPSRWTGRDFMGWKYGDCPPEFLDEMSNMLDAIGRKQSKDPLKVRNSRWSAKDAARARGWAARHRKNGTTGKADDAMPGGADDWDSETPF
jgi:hypothetical protein